MKRSYLSTIAIAGVLSMVSFSCANPTSDGGDQFDNSPDEVNPMPMTDSVARDTLSEDSLNPLRDTPVTP